MITRVFFYIVLCVTALIFVISQIDLQPTQPVSSTQSFIVPTVVAVTPTSLPRLTPTEQSTPARIISPTPTSLPIAATQLLINPSLEVNYAESSQCADRVIGAIAGGWIDNSCWNTSKIKYARDTAVVHGGMASQRIEVQKVDDFIIFAQAVPFQADRSYTATIWMRAQSPMIVQFILRKAGEPYTIYAENTFQLTSNWQLYHVSGELPTTDGMVIISTSMPGTFWVDEAQLIATLNAPSSNTRSSAIVLLKNPDFEAPYVSVKECTNRIKGVIAEGWIENTCWDPDAQIEYSQETQNVHKGRAAQRIQVKKARMQLIQPISFKSDHQYTASVWLRAQPGVSVALEFIKSTSPYTIYAIRHVSPGNEWQLYRLAVTLEDEEGYFMIASTTPGIFWVDDVSLTSSLQ